MHSPRYYCIHMSMHQADRNDTEHTNTNVSTLQHYAFIMGYLHDMEYIIHVLLAAQKAKHKNHAGKCWHGLALRNIILHDTCHKDAMLYVSGLRHGILRMEISVLGRYPDTREHWCVRNTAVTDMHWSMHARGVPKCSTLHVDMHQGHTGEGGKAECAWELKGGAREAGVLP